VLLATGDAGVMHHLRDLLGLASDVAVVATAGSGPEAVAAIGRFAPDVAFVDLQLPGLGGLAALRTPGRSTSPVFVPVSASDREAVAAFEVGAVDYLVRPLERERVMRALARAGHAVSIHRATAVRGEHPGAPPLSGPPSDAVAGLDIPPDRQAA
jgi:CheY-like chemotaxis protein